LLSSRLGHSLDPLALKVYRFFFRRVDVTPNVLTILGFIVALGASFLIGLGLLLPSGIMLLLSGLFDVLDGVVARNTGRVTDFGGFLDSVLDRYSDLAVTLAVLLFFVHKDDFVFAVLAAIASIGVAAIPYARARAEAAGVQCKSGLLERPERMILMILGLCFNLLRPAILLLALFTHVTVVQRVLLVKRAMRTSGRV